MTIIEATIDEGGAVEKIEKCRKPAGAAGAARREAAGAPSESQRASSVRPGAMCFIARAMR